MNTNAFDGDNDGDDGGDDVFIDDGDDDDGDDGGDRQHSATEENSHWSNRREVHVANFDTKSNQVTASIQICFRSPAFPFVFNDSFWFSVWCF